MSSSALPGAAEGASRARSGILTPSSESGLNRGRNHHHHHGHHGDASSPESRSMKRAASVAMDHLLKPSIAVKPHPPNLHVPPRVLHPLMLLPREKLPLASIDFAASNGDFPPSRFYESHVKVLDLESRMGGGGGGPIVLVARNESRGTTYALERQESGLYVMCKLGSWVDLESLAKYATAVAHERLQPIKPEWRDPVGINAITTPQIHHEQKKKRAAIEAIQSLVKKRQRSQSVSAFEDATKGEPTLEPDASLSQLPSPEIKSEQHTPREAEEKQPIPPSAPDLAVEQEHGPQQVASGIFDNIRTHYFDALYKSMGSLAYFAKGPLSRARSAFHLDLEANLDMADLIDFLKSLILTTVQIDKKYRETVPELISKMKDRVESSDEGRKRRRKPKKMKMGKDGLYPLESERILKWWNANMPEPSNETGISASQIKSHISILRTRETKLQMILIMEILALEPLKAVGDTGESNLPVLPGAADAQDQPMAAPLQPKKRNKHNLPVLIDVHADRLTIWQSTATDEQLLLEDSQSAKRPLDGNPAQKASSEPLKDFCVDVIVPFFSARLPELCDSINRKLGGPAVIAPVKSKSATRPSNALDHKPGTAAKRPTLYSARRTLQRALSTEQQNRRSVSRGASDAIALLRSATPTAIPSIIKRELGDTMALKAIQVNDSQKRLSLSRSSSMSNLQDAKASKKAEVEAELQEAISALRKPNREVVGKAMAEADERRTSAGLVTKKMKKPSRPSTASTVQVKATPANSRFKNMMPVKSEGSQHPPLETIEDLVPPSSVGAFVPSTGRPSHKNVFPHQRSASPEIDAVGDTPVKTSAKHSFLRRRPSDGDRDPAPQSSSFSSSFLTGGRTASSESFLIPGSAVKTRQGSSFGGGGGSVVETPLKKTAQRVVDVRETPDVKGAAVAQGGDRKKVSIYTRLGWDDDFDDLL